jgi:hypothetical protein
MRLLHTSELSLKHFAGDNVPEYVILSHTWGTDEVTFQDFQDAETACSKLGWSKIVGTCRQAAKDGYTWVWIDSCCKLILHSLYSVTHVTINLLIAGMLRQFGLQVSIRQAHRS